MSYTTIGVTVSLLCAIFLISQILTPHHDHATTQYESTSLTSYHKEKLIFYDDFEEFDLETWQHELTLAGGGNWEFQYYTNNRSNSYVRDGILYIKPTLTSDRIGKQAMYDGVIDMWGMSPADECTGNGFFGCMRQGQSSGPNDDSGNILNPIQSARIRTSTSLNFKYGRIEIRAKMPRGDWLWPAIWLLPRYNSYGAWPCSGEIDLIETRGNGPEYEHGGVDSMGSTLHWGPNWMENAWRRTTRQYRLRKGTFAEFHTFGMKWDEHGIYTYLDHDSHHILDIKFDIPFWKRGKWDRSTYDNPWKGRSNAAPFDQKFYLILNVAVGGVSAFFPDDPPPPSHNATSTSTHSSSSSSSTTASSHPITSPISFDPDSVRPRGHESDTSSHTYHHRPRKPWSNRDTHAVNTFYRAINQWYPTWKGEHAAMQVDWVKVWQ